MDKLTGDCNDEKIDILIRKVLKEQTENIDVSNRIKEEIDDRIKEKRIAGKYTKKEADI